MSIGIIITSILSGLAALICGCIGVVSDFRNPENGRLRKMGLVNLIILLAGSAFSVAALSLGFFKEVKDDEEQRNRFQATLDSQQEILNGIKRSIRPIGSAVVSVEVIYDESSGYPGSAMIELANELQRVPDFVVVENEGKRFFRRRIEDIGKLDYMLQGPAHRWNSALDLVEDSFFQIALVRGDRTNPEKMAAMAKGDFLANREGVGALWEGGLKPSREMTISMDPATKRIHVFYNPEQYAWTWSNGSIGYLDDLRDSQWYIRAASLGQNPSGINIITRVRLGSWQGVPLFNELMLKDWTLLDGDSPTGGKQSLWCTKVASSEITKAFGD